VSQLCCWGARIPADTAPLRRTFEAEPFFSFHHANAFEARGPDGRPLVVLDTVGNFEGVDLSANFESGPAYYDNDVGRGTLARVVLDLQASDSLDTEIEGATALPCMLGGDGPPCGESCAGGAWLRRLPAIQT
jgi:carotenoid cleavage dioxygenase-like enzyme